MSRDAVIVSAGIGLALFACGGGGTAGRDTGGGSPDAVNPDAVAGDPGGKPDGQSPDPGPAGDECLAAIGRDGKTTVTTSGAPMVLQEVASQAMNQMDTADSPLPARRLHAIAVGPCGTAAVLWFDAKPDGNGAARIVYQVIHPTPGAPEAVVEGVPAGGHDASLFLDGDCAPVVMKRESDGYAEYTRDAGGTWTRTPPPAPREGAVSNLAALAAWTDADGSLAVLGRAKVAGTPKGWLGRRPAAAGSAWSWASVDLPAQPETLAVRVAPNGTVHALYKKTVYPCDPCNLDLYYGRKAPGGAWVEETVQTSKWGAPDDEFAADPDLAVDASGEPVVAATYQRRVVTGSLKSAELRVYGRKAGTWCHEVVATTVDDYQGGDGTKMTGAAPGLAIDGSGRIHVVFQDLAQWHDSNGWSNGVAGQVRYAVRSGRTWSVATLVAQKGQSQQPRPLDGFLPTQVAIAPDGSAAWLAGASTSWDTDSSYNQQPMPMTFRGVVIRADLTWP